MKYLPLPILFFIAFHSGAENPVITDLYTADPSARVFGDTLYLYPSHDRDDARWWDMTDWHVFSTKDLVHFQDHGKALDLADISWAKEFAWAPDCIERNGKYYFYFPTDQDYIGVAVSDSPTGPFVDALGKPLISRDTPGVVNNRDLIDPCVFIDDDGQAYLFFGQLVVNVAKLNEDMITIDGPVQTLEGTDHFFEAIWMHKYNGIYYLSYSGDEQILYATSENIMGPYTYQGRILDRVNSITNHHSIVEFKGNWYLFYHNADLSFSKLPEGHPEREFATFRRSVCVDRLEYDENGKIKEVKMTREGVTAVSCGDHSTLDAH